MKSFKIDLSPQRNLRRILIFLISLLVVYLGTNTALAWIFTTALTHPACRTPTPLAGDWSSPEQVRLHTTDGLQLRAWYYPAKNGVAILSLGSMVGSLGDQPPPVDFLLDRGYGVLQIDSRACTQPSRPVTLGANEVWDAAAALQFLQNRPEVQHIGAFGFSMGAATAIRSAARYPAVEAVVAEGNYANLGDLFLQTGSPQSIPERIFRNTISVSYRLQTGQDPAQIDPLADLHRISPRPVLLIYGENELVPGDQDPQLQDNGYTVHLWIVPGGSHGRNYLLQPGAYQTRVLSFFDAALLGEN